MQVVSNCPACGCAHAERVASLDDEKDCERFRVYDQRKYGGIMQAWLRDIEPVIVQCVECRHSWFRTQPSAQQLSAMYEAGRPLVAVTSENREPSARMLAEMRRLRRLLARADAAPAMLDYGSGSGRWSRAAVQAGFRVTAFEPSVKRSADDRPPFRLINDLSEISGETFDAIQLEQVLEHVPDPVGTLRSVSALCHQRTIVRLTVPNILRAPEGGALWRTWPFDGSGPHTLAPFEHLHGFTPKSLRRAAHRAGFRPLSPQRLLRHYPLLQLRRAVGVLLPSLDTTSALLGPMLPPETEGGSPRRRGSPGSAQ